MGGKSRLGRVIYKQLLVLESKIGGGPRPYLEPFVGMCGVMRHVAADGTRACFASDINKDLVCMWQKVQTGWTPPLACTIERYNQLKTSKRASAERGFIGIVGTFGAVFFAGGCRLGSTKRDYLAEGRRSLLKMKDTIQTVDFMPAASYDTFDPQGFLIYCDPPYANCRVSKLFDSFDSAKFWETMREWSKNNIVVVSESSAPPDFKILWEHTSVSGITNNSRGAGVRKYADCLYIYTGPGSLTANF